MPLLDVTDVVTDPDFNCPMVVYRNAQQVGQDGIARLTPTGVRFFGVVTNDKGDVLDRFPGGERTEGSITVHTRTRLIEGKTGFTADIVEFQGRKYTVAAVNDYSQWGRGFIAARCDLLPLSQ